MDSAASSLLLATSDEAALNIASYVDNAWDLVCLARACKRFSVLYICAPPPEPPVWGRLRPVNPDKQAHLLAKPHVSLGRGRLRGETCDVLLPDVHHYSRRHCVVARRAGADGPAETTLTNLSANGTWFHPRGAQSGTRMFRGEEVRLRCGDRFSLVLPADDAIAKFGHDATVFEYEDGAALPEPPVERLSLVEESARKWLERLRPEYLAWVPRRASESHIGRMREVQQLLPGPLRLSLRHPTIELSADGFRATSQLGSGYRGVATSAVMRAGRHYAGGSPSLPPPLPPSLPPSLPLSDLLCVTQSARLTYWTTCFSASCPQTLHSHLEPMGRTQSTTQAAAFIFPSPGRAGMVSEKRAGAA